MVVQLAETLRYKPEDSEFNYQRRSGIFHWHNPSGPTITLGSTHPLTEVRTWNVSWGVKAVGA